MPQLIEPLVRPLVGQLIFSSSGSQAAPPPLADNYIGRWNFNSGVTSDGLRLVDDITPRGTVRPLQPGRCLLFNGTTQTFATTNTIGTGKAHAVVECWVNVLAASAGYKNIFYQNPSLPLDCYILTNTTVLETTLYTTGGASATNSPALSVGWNHIVFRFDRTLLPTNCQDLWVNGAKQSLTYVVTTGTMVATFGNSTWKFAASNGAANFYNSKMSGMRVIHPAAAWSDAACALLYTEALSGPQNYADTFCWLKLDSPSSALMMDSSGNGNHGTITNWATGMHYEGTDVPYSWQNEVGYSAYTDGVGTNLVADPNASLSVSEMTLTANQEYSPVLGTLVADKYFETVTNAPHTVGATDAIAISSTAANTPVICAVDIKLVGRTQVQFSVNKSDYSKYVLCGFTPGTGAITVTSQVTWTSQGGRITSLGGGWYRCELCVIVDAGNTDIRFRVMGVNVTDSYAGDVAKGFYLANKTLKIGSFAVPRNEATPTNDVLGNALQYTGQCPLQPVLGQSNCLTLNGTTQYANCGTGTWDTDGTQAMEISGWIKTTGTLDDIVCHQLGSGNFTGWELYTDSVGQISFNIRSTLADVIACNWLTVINDGTWHKFRITYDGSKTLAGLAAYIDDVRAVLSGAGTFTGSSSAASAMSSIGSRAGATGLLPGSLADINITIGSTTWHYPCSEGPGATQVYNTRADSGHGTLVNASAANWTTLQNVYHANQVLGHRTGANLLTYSEQFDNAYWAIANGTITPNYGTAPDGTSTAEKFVVSAAVAAHELYIAAATAPPVTSGTTYTLSCYLKYEGSQYARLAVAAGFTSTPRAFFDLQNGTIFSQTGATAVITSIGSGWYRCSITMAATSTTIMQLAVNSSSNGVAVTTPSDGTSGFGIWGIQFEAASTPSTYQRTIANPGTTRTPARNGSTLLSADGLTLTNPPGIYNDAAESTIDFTCGQPLATAWNGKTVPTAHLFGAATTDLRKRSVSAAQEDRYNILK